MNTLLRVSLAVLTTGIVAVAGRAAAPALKDAFADDFLVGAAINPAMLKPEHPAHALLMRHFNSITPTNLMKWERYNPEPGVFNDEPAEAFFAFAAANHYYAVGHTLFWHQQTPAWVFQKDGGGDAGRELLLSRMHERVRRVAKLYGARTQAWDVVNETFLDDGSLRVSPYTRILGADFVTEAFRLAQAELPPSVALLYNDYNLEAPGKVRAVVELVEKIRSQGLRINAVGNQAHWRLDSPTIAEIEASLIAFKAAKVRVHYTELDIELLPRNDSGAEITTHAELTTANNPYPNGLTPELQEKLAARYAQIFALFHRYADVIERVTFWGVTDADSWLNNWPVRGRTNYPLLFDRQAQPKPAFDAVIGVAPKRP